MKYPEKGFYYHYKHNLEAEFNLYAYELYAYEVIGVTRDTEDKKLSVLYRPLYECDFMQPANFLVRPLEMFIGEVSTPKGTLPRFAKITDPSLVGKLEKVRDQMYKK